MIRRIAGGGLVLLVLAGCEDVTGVSEAYVVSDTVELAAPTSEHADLPSAVDLSAYLGTIAGGRYPERAEDAEQWDLALRQRGGELVLAPPSVLGLLDYGARISTALEGETYASLREAPGSSAFQADSAVVLRESAVYVAITREVSCLYSASGLTTGHQYAKLQPLLIDRANGRVLLEVATNEICDDPRLVVE